MLTGGRVSGAFVVSVALLVAGCSSSGGKQSTPTTASRPSMTTNGLHGATGFVLPTGPSALPPTAHSVAKLGRCPLNFPSAPAEKLTPSVVNRLSQRLVPMTAVKVLICEYVDDSALPAARRRRQHLVRTGLLTGSDATRFEDETNRLRSAGTPSGGGCVRRPRADALTFASSSEQVTVDYVCPDATNGWRYGDVRGTPWLDELLRYTRPTALVATPTGDPSVIGAKPREASRADG
jgi:hypothetical protein